MGYISVADIIGLSLFVYPLLLTKVAKSGEIPTKFDLRAVQVIQGHRSSCQSKAHVRPPISH